MAAIAGSLGALRYQRSDESEADREGLRLLRAAGIDPSGMITFMRALERESKAAPALVSYLSSHPPTAERVVALEAQGVDMEAQARPLVDADAWERARRICAR